jgi:hypothetical protein
MSGCMLAAMIISITAEENASLLKSRREIGPEAKIPETESNIAKTVSVEKQEKKILFRLS